MALDEAEVKGETKPISNDGTTKNTPQANDEEARLREVLSKKKIIQKKSRRQNSGADGDAGGGGQDVNDNKNASPAKKKEGQDSEGNAGSQRKSAAPAGAAGETNEKSGGNPVGDGKAANNNRRVRRRRRRNRGARGVSRNAGMGGGRGGGPPMPDSRSFYGGGPDYRGPPGPGYYGGDRGGGWDRRGPPPRRGGGYWDERGRGDHAGRGWRDNRDPHGPPSRGRGRSPVGGGNERGRSPSRSYSRGSSRSSRSFSSSSRSRSSGSRSYSSRSRSRSYSHSSGSRSRSRSYSRSPSRSRSVSPLDKNRKRDRSHSNDGDVSRERRRSKSPTAKSSGNKSRSRSTSPRAVRDGSSERKRQRSEEKEPDEAENALTKDQRTVFVSQLVMRADDRDIRRYFKRKVGAKVRDVILLRDKRTGRHKGCAYVELGSLRDVERALDASGKNPDFQRFPILIKRTEAEKNYTDGLGLGVTTGDPGMAGAIGGTMDTAALAVQLTADGRRIESQKVYVGNVDRCVTQAQLYVLFSQFGPLEKVLLQMDPTTGISRGFAFLSYHDPKDANLAIQTMSGQLLAGRPLKTGWANQQSSIAGVEEVRADLFPSDSNEKVQKVNVALTQLTGSGLVTMLPQVDPSQQQALLAAGSAGALGILPAAQLASVAEAALDMALGASVPVNLPPTQMPAVPPVLDAKIVGRSENPSQHILVHNMFDKDEETDEGWETEIKLDFEEECAQYGKIVDVKVMSKEPGGKIYASFDAIDGATNCAKSLAGRWFDKRQLKVEFVDSIPS